MHKNTRVHLSNARVCLKCFLLVIVRKHIVAFPIRKSALPCALSLMDVFYWRPHFIALLPPQTTYIAICKSEEIRKCQEANKDYAAIQYVFESISNSIPQADLSFQFLYFVILLKKLLILFQRQSHVLRYATGVEHIIAIGITSELLTPDFTPICNFLLQPCVFCVLFVSSLSQNIRNHNAADR